MCYIHSYAFSTLLLTNSINRTVYRKLFVVPGKQQQRSIDDVFNYISFPEKVKSLYVHSEIPYRSQFNYYPGNVFELFIDFSKLRVFNFSEGASRQHI